MIWKFSSKTKNLGVSTGHCAVVTAVSKFNNGTSGVGQMLKKMDIEAGVYACDFFKQKRHTPNYHCADSGKTVQKEKETSEKWS